MTTFAQRRADQEARERARPIAPALVSIGTRTASVTSGGRATSMEVDQLVDRRTMRLVAFGYEDGSLEYVGPGPPTPKPEPLGVIRRRGPARSQTRSDPPPEVVHVTAERLRLAEMVSPGSTRAIRAIAGVRTTSL